MRWARVERRLATIRSHISKLRNGSFGISKMYHVLNKSEAKQIEDFCKENQLSCHIIVTNENFSSILFGDLDQFYARDDKEYYGRYVYVRVTKLRPLTCHTPLEEDDDLRSDFCSTLDIMIITCLLGICLWLQSC